MGELTDALGEFGSGTFIEKYVSGDPNNYAYPVRNSGWGKRSYKCKVKGIALNYVNPKAINCSSTRHVILENGDPLHARSPKKLGGAWRVFVYGYRV